MTKYTQYHEVADKMLAMENMLMQPFDKTSHFYDFLNTFREHKLALDDFSQSLKYTLGTSNKEIQNELNAYLIAIRNLKQTQGASLVQYLILTSNKYLLNYLNLKVELLQKIYDNFLDYEKRILTACDKIHQLNPIITQLIDPNSSLNQFLKKNTYNPFTIQFSLFLNNLKSQAIDFTALFKMDTQSMTDYLYKHPEIVAFIEAEAEDLKTTYQKFKFYQNDRLWLVTQLLNMEPVFSQIFNQNNENPSRFGSNKNINELMDCFIIDLKNQCQPLPIDLDILKERINTMVKTRGDSMVEFFSRNEYSRIFDFFMQKISSLKEICGLARSDINNTNHTVSFDHYKTLSQSPKILLRKSSDSLTQSRPDRLPLKTK